MRKWMHGCMDGWMDGLWDESGRLIWTSLHCEKGPGNDTWGGRRTKEANSRNRSWAEKDRTELNLRDILKQVSAAQRTKWGLSPKAWQSRPSLNDSELSPSIYLVVKACQKNDFKIYVETDKSLLCAASVRMKTGRGREGREREKEGGKRGSQWSIAWTQRQTLPTTGLYCNLVAKLRTDTWRGCWSCTRWLRFYPF